LIFLIENAVFRTVQKTMPCDSATLEFVTCSFAIEVPVFYYRFECIMAPLINTN